MRCIQITDKEPKNQIKNFYSKKADKGTDFFNKLDVNKKSQKSSLDSAGCDFPLEEKELRGDEKVLEIGAGGGINCHFVSEKLGPQGEVIGLDFSSKMAKKAKKGLSEINDEVEIIIGDGEQIPIKENCFDITYTNCVLNLVDKNEVLSEIHRVTKKTGSIFFSEIISNREVPKELKKNLKAWVTCLAGAITENKLEKVVNKNNLKINSIQEKKKILEIEEHDICFYKTIFSVKKT